jgi:hypothetical protein
VADRLELAILPKASRSVACDWLHRHGAQDSGAHRRHEDAPLFSVERMWPQPGMTSPITWVFGT